MRLSFAIAALLLAASMAWAQANLAPNQTGSQSGQAQGQSTSKPAAPGAAPAPPSSGGSRVLQAKSPEEYKAYQEGYAKTDPAEMEVAANDFAAKFPTSELRAALYVRTMNLYAQRNNSEKLIAVGRKAIAADPTNPVPLAEVAFVLAESTRDTDLDREQRLDEAAKDAESAIKNLDTGFMFPPNAPPDKVAADKAIILSNSYSALAKVDLDRKDYTTAEQHLVKAIEITKTSPESALYLRLSIAQDHLKKYPQALDSANKAVQYAAQGSPDQANARHQQDRLQKLIAAESPASPATPPTTAPAPAKPETTTSPSNATPPTTPH